MSNSNIVIGALMVVSILIYHILFSPNYAKINANIEYINTLEEIINNSDKIQTLISEASTAYNSIDRDVTNSIDAAIPRLTSESFIQTYRLIDHVARLSGIASLDGVSLSRSSESESGVGLVAYTLSFSVQDISYSSLKNLLINIESWSRVVSINSIRISGNNNGDVSAGVELEFIFSN